MSIFLYLFAGVFIFIYLLLHKCDDTLLPLYNICMESVSCSFNIFIYLLFFWILLHFILFLSFCLYVFLFLKSITNGLLLMLDLFLFEFSI